MGCLLHLECSQCGAIHSADDINSVCTQCGRPLLARYDLKQITANHPHSEQKSSIAMTPLIKTERLSEKLGDRERERLASRKEPNELFRHGRRIEPPLGLSEGDQILAHSRFLVAIASVL